MSENNSEPSGAKPPHVPSILPPSARGLEGAYLYPRDLIDKVKKRADSSVRECRTKVNSDFEALSLFFSLYLFFPWL